MDEWNLPAQQFEVFVYVCVCGPSIDLQSPYLSAEHEKPRQDSQEEKD